jgi:hypothetical protein
VKKNGPTVFDDNTQKIIPLQRSKRKKERDIKQVERCCCCCMMTIINKNKSCFPLNYGMLLLLFVEVEEEDAEEEAGGEEIIKPICAA